MVEWHYLTACFRLWLQDHPMFGLMPDDASKLKKKTDKQNNKGSNSFTKQDRKVSQDVINNEPQLCLDETQQKLLECPHQSTF